MIWIAILLFCDAGLALWHERRVARVFPKLNVKMFALIEASLALLLTVIHFIRQG